jgi:HEAT repeat protein
MAATRVSIKLLFGVVALCGASLIPVRAQVDAKVDEAVAVLRNVAVEGLSDAQKQAKAKQIDEAWKLLIAKGPEASNRLKHEIEKVDAGQTKDDFFKLNATVVLWNIGKANEADYIAKVWKTTPVSSQYTYVFLTAFEAAQTQDARVLPILGAILKDDKGSIYVAAHAMNVAWPLSHEFIWGSFGPSGLPALADILENSKDEVELKSAIYLLSKAQYLPALPRIRQLAGSNKDDVRRQAVRALGVFGHPSDFDLLISGLRSPDPRELFSHAFALYEFEDERAVKDLVLLLNKGDDQSRVEVSLALLHLLTPESLSAVKDFVTKTSNPEVKAFLSRSITLREDKLPKDYKLKSGDEQARILARQRNAELTLGANEQPISNKQLLEALRIWKEKGRIYDSGVDWVGEAKLIAAANAENLDQLLDTKARFYRRLSDECLYETSDIDKVVKYVGRSRYRIGIGVTPKAEPK